MNFSTVLENSAVSPPENFIDLVKQASEKFKENGWLYHAKLQCDYYNSKAYPPSDDYDCPKCKNRGNFMVINADGDTVIRKCDCEKIHEQYYKAKKSGMLGMLKAHTFEKFIVKDDFQKLMKDTAARYLKNAENQWLVLAGQSGAGKTHLCSAVCDGLIKKGETVKYETWGNINAKIDALRYNYAELEDYKKILKNPDMVLYIDDFLKTDTDCVTGRFTTPSHKELINAFEVINSRVISRAKTIISSELLIDEIIQLDSALGGRIYQASGAYLVQIARMDKRNYRIWGSKHD